MANEPLQYGRYYHIFNRGNNGEILFAERRNYRFFLQRYAQHIQPVAVTYAYCLLPNHFHFVIRTRTEEEQEAYLQEQHKKAGPILVTEPTGPGPPMGRWWVTGRRRCIEKRPFPPGPLHPPHHTPIPLARPTTGRD
jgi:hypothetical protein